MQAKGLLLAITMLVPAAVCGQVVIKPSCADTDRQCALVAMINHDTRKLDTWQAVLAMPVSERIGAASPQLVEYLTLDEIKNGFPDPPRVTTLDAGFMADAKAAMAECNAIQYILLHEPGHVLSVGSGVHPAWFSESRSIEQSASYPFLTLSWKIDQKANRYTNNFDTEFPQRLQTVHYFGASSYDPLFSLPVYAQLRQDARGDFLY